MAYWCGELCTHRAKQCCTVWNMGCRLRCDLCKSSCPHDTREAYHVHHETCSQSPAPCNWHGSQLHDCVLPSFLKMFVPQGIRWLQIWGVFFIFTYVTYVFIQFYTPLVGIMSSAQSRAWSCHLCYETNGCFIFRECQCVLLGTAWIDWTRPNDTNTTFQVSTPLITWCLTVYSMSDFLLLFQVRSSSSSESPPSSSNGHGRQWLRSSFFLFFWSCPWPPQQVLAVLVILRLDSVGVWLYGL